MQVTKEGSVRVDLVGGTLDLEPIHLVLKDVVTLNVATSLKAKVILHKTDENCVEIISHDYNSTNKFQINEFSEENLYDNDHFGPLKFVCQILDYFGIHSNLKMELSSGAPAGSGLGGSSAMGVTLFNALCDFTGTKHTPLEMIQRVKGIEGRILNQGIPGYQDYYPALHGGVLGLKAAPGEVIVDQLFTNELKEYLENHVLLVFSGKSRLSGINNWEMYKAFFDKDEKVRKGLTSIADISHKTYQAIKNKDFDSLVSLIGQEGEERKKLFPNIVSPEMTSLYDIIVKEHPEVGLKVCGAGGGGCFILVHPDGIRDKLTQLVAANNMELLEFKIEAPLV
jgi:D-glycero-alpha-D-manno-heptose-7-phosphate kinase